MSKTRRARARGHSEASFQELVSTDPEIEAARVRASKLLKRIDFDAIYDECNNMHSSRITRTILTSEILADQAAKLTEVSLQNTAFRSRMVEIKVMVLRAAMTAEELITAAQGMARTRYADALAAVGRTAPDRAAALSNMAQRENRMLARCEAVMKMLDILIEDLDQTGWNLKRIEGAVAMVHSAKSAAGG